MKSALPQHSSVAARDFADGLGVRTVIAERGTELLELLSVAAEFVAGAAFSLAPRGGVSPPPPPSRAATWRAMSGVPSFSSSPEGPREPYADELPARVVPP